MLKTYFGLNIYDEYYVLEEEIKQLPFYDFWLESSKGSTYTIKDNKEYIYLPDWEIFCNRFIKTGKNRFQ